MDVDPSPVETIAVGNFRVYRSVKQVMTITVPCVVHRLRDRKISESAVPVSINISSIPGCPIVMNESPQFEEL